MLQHMNHLCLLHPLGQAAQAAPLLDQLATSDPALSSLPLITHTNIHMCMTKPCRQGAGVPDDE
jgi:hypothetical protein